jgi:hypothetical protein
MADIKSTLNNFVDAISTSGGGVLMLAVASLILLGALLFSSHFHFAADDVITIRTTFVGFSGALLLALKSEGKTNSSTDKTSITVSEEKKQ